jgi:hypothetical protein
MAKPFPKTIHVLRSSEGTEDEYLFVADDTEGTNIDETQDVAIYQLVEVGRLVVTRTVEKKYERRHKGRQR